MINEYSIKKANYNSQERRGYMSSSGGELDNSFLVKINRNAQIQ